MLSKLVTKLHLFSKKISYLWKLNRRFFWSHADFARVVISTFPLSTIIACPLVKKPLCIIPLYQEYWHIWWTPQTISNIYYALFRGKACYFLRYKLHFDLPQISQWIGRAETVLITIIIFIHNHNTRTLFIFMQNLKLIRPVRSFYHTNFRSYGSQRLAWLSWFCDSVPTK